MIWPAVLLFFVSWYNNHDLPIRASFTMGLLVYALCCWCCCGGGVEEETANATAEMIVKITPFGIDAPRLLIRFVFFAEKIKPANASE